MKQSGMSLLVADIGGTNVRFGVAADATAPLEHVRIMTCASYPTFADAIADFLAPLDITISLLSVAVAGPVNDDLVDVTNNHWAFDKVALMHQLGVDGILVINDFTAQALAQTPCRAERHHRHSMARALLAPRSLQGNRPRRSL